MQLNDKVQHVYLVGAKSLGAYGGYETFVYKLTEYHQNKENIKYHVACKANGDGCIDCRKAYSHSTSDNLWSLQWCHFYAPFLPAVYGKYKERGGRPVFHPADSETLTIHGQAQFLDVRG